MCRKTITMEDVLEWGPCTEYDLALLKALADGRRSLTPLEVLALDILIADRLWVVLREELLPAKQLRLFACRCADRAFRTERVAGREPDERSVNAVRIARRFAAGKATDTELAAAWAAAGAAAWAAAGAAAGAAARAAARAAAGAAARAAAGAAAGAAARAAAGAAAGAWQRQLADIRRVFRKMKTNA